MTSDLSQFAARLRRHFDLDPAGPRAGRAPISTGADFGNSGCSLRADAGFNQLALELFALQFERNQPYRKLCDARGIEPSRLEHWTQIPAVPAAAFKEHEFSCLPADERVAVFHSSGTTVQRPSRHFHSAESQRLYEASLWPWFKAHLLPNLKSEISNLKFLALTPPPEQCPHSSLVHMFETIRRRLGAGSQSGNSTSLPARSERSGFAGTVAPDGGWILDREKIVPALRSTAGEQRPLLLLGTAFSFVHLLDELARRNLRFELPPGSRAMETGGYKGRSRALPKAALHAMITDRLGVPATHIVCEYGMSELSSQAYDGAVPGWLAAHEPAALSDRGRADLTVGWNARPACRQAWQGVPTSLRDPRHDSDAMAAAHEPREHRTSNTEHRTPNQGSDQKPLGVWRSIFEVQCLPVFHFPPWCRAQIIEPESGREAAEGQTGLVRLFDLANGFSVMAIQTEDLAVRRGDGFELIGRATPAEPRGCSLMNVEPLNR